ncbi:MAG: NADP-dependent oxidoreductase [Novosphingobium sp.]|nr:NADP-dependent oxidoreductase [Novosphingobium sp.]
MGDRVNRRIILHTYPSGLVAAADNFAMEAMPVPEVGENEFLVRNRWLSVDPMIRVFIDRNPMGGRMPAMPLGALVPGAAVGEVIESRHPDYVVGDMVEGRFGWQDFALSDGNRVVRVDPELGPPQAALGILGLPGFSAYVGLAVAGALPAGASVLVSGAAGAVGSAVGALLDARGIRAVGIASGAGKRDYLLGTIGYRAVVDRTAPDFADRLAAALPEGAALYFDNAGGPIMLDVLPHVRAQGTVLICGLMAQYGDMGEGPGPDRLPPFLSAVMAKGLTVRAFSNTSYPELRQPFADEMAAIVRRKPALVQAHEVEGLEQTPAAFVRLFTEGTTGKVLVRL